MRSSGKKLRRKVVSEEVETYIVNVIYKRLVI